MIAHGDINIISHFDIRGYVPFSKFCRLNFYRQNSIKFVFSRSELVENDAPLAYVRPFYILRPFCTRGSE